MCAQLLTPISTHSNRTIHFYNLAVFSFRLHAFQFVHGVRASVEFDMRANIFCVIACSLDALQFASHCIIRRSTFLIFYYSFVSIPCVHVKLNANGDGEEERNSYGTRISSLLIACAACVSLRHSTTQDKIPADMASGVERAQRKKTILTMQREEWTRTHTKNSEE